MSRLRGAYLPWPGLRLSYAGGNAMKKGYKSPRTVCQFCHRDVSRMALSLHMRRYHAEPLPTLGGFRPGAGRKVKHLFTNAGAKAVLALFRESWGNQDEQDNLDPELKTWLLANVNLESLARLADYERNGVP
jgi:hypothetical protein